MFLCWPSVVYVLPTRAARFGGLILDIHGTERQPTDCFVRALPIEAYVYHRRGGADASKKGGTQTARSTRVRGRRVPTKQKQHMEAEGDQKAEKVRRSSCPSLVLSGEKQGYVPPARKSIFPKQLTKHLPEWRKLDILPDSKRQMFAADPALREAICWIVGGCHS